MISTNDPAIDATSKPDGWNAFSTSYQNRIGACTMHGTARLVDGVAERLSFNGKSFVLDNGTGGGSIVRNIKQKFPSTKILATDISPGMLSQVDSIHLPGVTTQIEDACNLSGLADDSFTHSLSSFMIQFTPDMMSTVNSMHRTLKPDGVVGFAIWGNGTDIGTIHNAACARVNPAYKLIDTYPSSSWSGQKEQEAAMVKAGFKDVEVESMDMPFQFDSGQEVCEWWFGNYGNPVAKKLIGHWQEHGGNVTELKQAMQEVVKEHFDDGRSMKMEAVLAWGRK